MFRLSSGNLFNSQATAFALIGIFHRIPRPLRDCEMQLWKKPIEVLSLLHGGLQFFSAGF